jgi:hypothetical protein
LSVIGIVLLFCVVFRSCRVASHCGPGVPGTVFRLVSELLTGGLDVPLAKRLGGLAVDDSKPYRRRRIHTLLDSVVGGGYHDRFADLHRALQDSIITRTHRI